MKSLKTMPLLSEYRRVIDVLVAGSFWCRDWAARQYVGLVLTGMCVAAVDNKLLARRFAALRVMETFLEHRHNLFPRTEEDLRIPRNRVAHLAVPGSELECSRWIDILEYLQVRNWAAKGLEVSADHLEGLRSQICTEFTSELANEIDALPREFWLYP